MKIQGTSVASPLQRTKTQAQANSNEQGSDKPNNLSISVDLASIGSAASKGVRGGAGLVSSALSLPKAVIAPTLASAVGRNDLYTAELTVGGIGGAVALGGASYAYLAPFDLPAAVFAGVFGGMFGAFGGVVATAGAQVLRNSIDPTSTGTVFDYDGILKAKQDARLNTEGSDAAKAGASFIAGYKTALGENFQAGGNAMNSTIDFVRGASGVLIRQS